MKNQSAVELGKLGGAVKSERKAKTSAENGKKGGRPTLYNQAYSRMETMGWSKDAMFTLFAIFSDCNKHYRWLLSATRQEIANWITNEWIS